MTAIRKPTAEEVPPAGWDKEIPRYLASRALKPAERARYRFERPFSTTADPDVWQYGTEPIAAGQKLETTSWPHESFLPMNESAKRVLAFFKLRMKSRLQVSPWRNGRVYLDDGLTGGTITPAMATTPKLQPVGGV